MDSEPHSIFNYVEQDKAGRSSRVPHALAIAASTVIILAGVQAASGLVGPMLLALFFAIVLLVPLRWLQRRGCPQFLAFLFVLTCTIALFVGLSYFVSQSLTDFITKIPAYKDRFVEKYTALESRLWDLGFVIGDLGDKLLPNQPISNEPELSIPELIPETPAPATIAPAEPLADTETEVQTDEESSELAENSKSLVDDVPGVPLEEVREWAETEPEPSLIALDPQSIALWLARFSLYIRDILEGGFLVLLFTIFMLFEAAHFPSKIRRALSKDSPMNIEHFHRIAEDLRRYLFLKTVANLMSGSAAMLVYYLFGIPAAFFWGIVAFFMYYIPNIGGTLAAVIPGALIFMVHDIPGVLLYAVCLITIECAIAYGIEPKILGHGLHLSTIVIILSLFFWGFLLGPIGLFLAAPLTVMIKIILQAYPETQWLAIFLDGSREKA